MTIPYDWISLCDENPVGPGVRWDSAWLERFLTGQEWRVPGGFPLEHRPLEPGEGGILIFPCGHYYDHREASRALVQIDTRVRSMPWCVLIATSDEGSKFPWWRFRPNSTTRLWVQTPRTDLTYPRGTRFIGFGSPTPASGFSPVIGERGYELFFSGQVTHERRYLMWAALQDWIEAHPESRFDVMATDQFATGYDEQTYREYMGDASVVLAPSGPETQDSFRCYEALEAGAVPLQDALRPGSRGAGYWDLIGLNLMEIEDWGEMGAKIETAQQPLVRAQISAQWQQYKRTIAHRIHDDVASASEKSPPTGTTPDDLITVVIPSSPTPHHPDTSMIISVVDSIRERLPLAEILITCDGVREEQMHRRDKYIEYLDRLTQWTNRRDNIVPIIYRDHMHESGMLKRMIHEIRTPYVLYIESDTYLVGDIDFQQVLNEMRDWHLNGVRFTNEAHVPPSHERLFLETKPLDGCNHLRTVQLSTRPNVWDMRWLRRMVDTYIGTDSRSMIEDLFYGPVQHGWAKPYADQELLRSVWEKHRQAVWAVGPNIKRSEHLDGRGEDPKYANFVAYDGEVPEGGTWAGQHEMENL